MLRPIMLTFCLCASAIANQPAANKKAEPVTTVKAFKPFTGKVSANKVRIRDKPELESHIIRQVNKNDLVLVVGEEGDFYAIEPPKGTKAYIFRSYALDNVIEASRVNIRLEPHADAPIIGQLEAGAKIDAQVCAINHKWLEIPTPTSTRFYICKEFIANAGGPEYLATMEKRKQHVDEMLNAAYMLAEAECRKQYESMSIAQSTEQFQNIIRNFSDFPEAVQQAKEGLAHLKDTYLNKKIAFLESNAKLSDDIKEELIAKHKEETQEFLSEPTHSETDPHFWSKRQSKKKASQGTEFWDSLEESLYLSWSAFHTGKKMEDFYTEQRANAIVLTGKVEHYSQLVKDKPGDYILKGSESPIAYLYSTHVNLENYAGKTISLVVAPRPNNHFAFPAYFVLSVE